VYIQIKATLEETIMGNTMSMLLKLKKKKGEPAKWVLKAKPAGSSDWEDIETYDEPKSYSDLKDIIDELKNEGYEAVRLDAYDKSGRFVKRIFTRYFSTSKTLTSYQQMQKMMNDLLEQQISFLDRVTSLVNKLAERMGSGTSYEDAIAQILYLKELERQIANALGLSPNQVQNPEFTMFLMDILKELIKKYMPEIEQRIAEKFGAKKPPTPFPSPTPSPTPMPTPTPPPKVEVPPDIQKIIEDAKQKVFEQTLPPCVKEGICKEGE